MNKKEMIRSAVIGLLALAGLIVWLKTYPPLPDQWKPASAGEMLFPAYTDTAAVRTIRITQRGESGNLERLELVRSTDGWRIGGNDAAADAPAENSDRIASVLAPLINLTALTVTEPEAGTKEEKIDSFHRTCGLLDPVKTVGDESKDAGILLEIGGEDSEVFVRAIIGRQPPESSSVRDIRYLRMPDQETIITVDFSAETAQGAGEEKAPPFAERLSTAPLDWMNRDLLRISRWKIAEFFYFPYTADAAGTMTMMRQALFRQDPEKALDQVWSAAEDRTFNAGEPVEGSLEETPYDSAWINKTADALGRIRFSGIEHKPEPLPELLRTKRPIQELAAEKGLLGEYGFYIADCDPLRKESADPYLCGEGGEVRLTMTDGVAYRVIFGKKGENGRAVMVLCSLDETVFSAEDKTESERELNRAEGEKKAKDAARRFDDWFYAVSEEDYREIFSGK